MSHEYFHDITSCWFSVLLINLAFSIAQECIIEPDYGNCAVLSTSCAGVFARLALALHTMDTPTAKWEVRNGMLELLLTRWRRWRSDDFSKCTFFSVILNDTYIVLILNFFDWTDAAPCRFITILNFDLLRDLPVKIAGINFGSYGERSLPLGYTFATCVMKGDLLANSIGT